jgi:PhzF family phenazine biosynthesis protein
LRTVDAFADRPFMGNPAAILMLDETPPDDWMAAVARETNLSDTGFVICEDVPDADFRLRWFTPTVEIDLCGHATLASAHCLFEDGYDGPIRFATRSGILTVTRQADGSLAMDFPAWPSADHEAAMDAVANALGAPVQSTSLTDNGAFLLALMSDETAVRDARPDLDAVALLSASVGLIPTAEADPEAEHPGGPRHRQRAHRPRPLLGSSARPHDHDRTPGLSPVGTRRGRTARRPRDRYRPRSHRLRRRAQHRRRTRTNGLGTPTPRRSASGSDPRR